MAETTITRGGQITLTKDIREKLDLHIGDTVQLNLVGSAVLVSKKDPAVFGKGNFLPENFTELRRKHRKTTTIDRLKKQGILP